MDGWITIGTKIDDKSFDAQIKELEDKLESLEKEFQLALKDSDFPEEELKKYEVEIEKTKNKIVGLRKQQVGLNKDVSNTNIEFDKVSKKVGKLALGIFSIRSAYMLVRQATNQLASENEEIGQKISAIKGSLTNLLAPAIEWVVNLVYKLLGYLNVITKTFLGIDLFAKTKKSAKETTKSAQKLKKTLASFDEMNVLNDTSSSGSSGGGGSKELEPPKVNEDFINVVEKYKKMWDDLLKIDQTEARNLLMQSDKNWGTFLAGIFDSFQGVAKIFKGLFTGDLKLIGEGFLQYVQGLIELIIGIIKGLLGTILDIGKSIIKSIGDFISKVSTKISDFGKSIKTKVSTIFTNIKTTISNTIDKIKGFFTNMKTHIVNIWEGIKTSLKAPLNVMIGWVNKVINGLNKISVDIPDWVPGFGGQKWGFNIKTIPKLAQGGIVNNPGRGVNMGSYIAGERGAEAVLPLTDDTLQRLANMIPITINLTNSMNGRVISRELQKIQNQNGFASNWR